MAKTLSAQLASAKNIKDLFDDADTSEFNGCIAIHDHIEKFRGTASIKAFVDAGMVEDIGKVRRLSSIHQIHRVIKYLREELVDVDGVQITADAYIAGTEYLIEMNHWDDIIRYAKKFDLHILDALDATADMDWTDIKKANGSGGKSKMQLLREYLEDVTNNGATPEAKAVAIKALGILS
jgi:hypothetical protein